MTPREVEASLHFAEIDLRHEAAERIADAWLTSRSGQKDAEKRLRELQRDDD